MSKFQDDAHGNDSTQAFENDPIDTVEIFTEDIERELKGLIQEIDEEFRDPETRADSVLADSTGRIARSYLHYWLTCFKNDHNDRLEASTDLRQMLLFIAMNQAAMDERAMGGQN